MYKIAVMGDYDSIYGFASLGLTVFPFEDKDLEEAGRTVHRLAAGGYGIIYMTEHLAEGLQKEIAKYQGQLVPTIILIPGVKGNTGRGIAQVKKSVDQAVGSDILFGNDEN